MNESTAVRRLTTIMAIDVVGFSTMAARNEEHALALLRSRMAIAETYIKQHRGRVFKMTGDGLLAEFASPVETVRAAVEIQEAMRTTNALAAENDRLSLRIGANLGDVVENGEDLLGDAVNVAVRLESIAQTDGICVSSSIYEQIVGKLTLGADDLGEQQVKNIPRPVRAYRLKAEAAPPTPVPRKPAGGMGRSRLFALAGVGVAALAVGAGWMLLQRTGAAPVPTTAKVASATVPNATPVPATPPTRARPASPAPGAAARTFVAADVPFATTERRRALEAYATAEGAKAVAINIRGIAEFATRRVDDAAARSVALEGCRTALHKQVRVVREFDHCMIYAVGDKVVWSFKDPAVPPLPYLAATRPTPSVMLDMASVPLIGDASRKALTDEYLKSKRDRALVLGRDGQEWWASAATEPDAIRRALQACGHLTGRACFVYAIGDQVVIQTPQKFKIVETFTPEDLSGADGSQREALAHYLVADDWRAIAVSRNGRFGIASGRGSEEAATETALRECARAGGTDCAVSAIGPFLVTRN
jgi:adenylate cyclase